MTNPIETKFLALTLEAPTDEDTPKGTIVGYGSVFGVRDNGGDIVARGAFAKSLSRDSRPKMLWQHDPACPIGVWDEIVEDEHGLRLKGRINLDIQQGREAYSLLDMGAIDGLSIGYRATRASKSGTARVIEEVYLREISIVSFPMNEAAAVESVKAGERNGSDGSTSPENDTDAANAAPEEESSMTPEQLKAAIAEAFATGASNAEIAELKSKLAAAEAKIGELDELKSRLNDLETKAARGTTPAGDTGDGREIELKTQFGAYLRAPEKGLEAKEFSLSASSGSGGQYAIPHTLLPGLTEVAHEESILPSLVGRRRAAADSYTELLELADGNYEWVGETDDRGITANATIAEREAHFGEISAIVEISRKSLTDASFDVEGYIIRSAKRTFALAEAAAILTGNAVKKPAGLFPSAAVAGAPTITTIAAIALPTFTTETDAEKAEEMARYGVAVVDQLIELVEGTHPAYQDGFVMSQTTRGKLRKLRDRDGNAIYQPALSAGTPATLLGHPVRIDNTVSGILFGNLSRAYVAVDVSDKALSILVDPFTRKGFIRYYLYKRVGGMILDEKAVKRLAIA